MSTIESEKYNKLILEFEKKHIYDIEWIQDTKWKLSIDEIDNLLDCILNNANPITDTVKFGMMKYTCDYNKNELFKIMLNGFTPALFIFSMLCHKDDSDIYINNLLDSNELRDKINVINYLKVKIIINTEDKKKIKSKELFLKAINILNNIPNDFNKSVLYYKYICNYHIGNYDMALVKLIKFLSVIRYYNLDICEIYTDKLNKLKLYIEINKLPNRELFISILNKLKEDEKLKKFNNKLDSNIITKCDQCKDEKICIQYYSCKHNYCVDCIKCKICNICKGKCIS
jgi:tetratricopeptide (TPR) repeat protein